MHAEVTTAAGVETCLHFHRNSTSLDDLEVFTFLPEEFLEFVENSCDPHSSVSFVIVAFYCTVTVVIMLFLRKD